jgi:hypothetical protein
MPPPVVGFSPGITILKPKTMGFVMKSKRSKKRQKIKSGVGKKKIGGKFKRKRKTSKKGKRGRRRRKKSIPSNIPAVMDMM